MSYLCVPASRSTKLSNQEDLALESCCSCDSATSSAQRSSWCLVAQDPRASSRPRPRGLGDTGCLSPCCQLRLCSLVLSRPSWGTLLTRRCWAPYLFASHQCAHFKGWLLRSGVVDAIWLYFPCLLKCISSGITLLHFLHLVLWESISSADPDSCPVR